jgi:hypothetical protein
MPVAPKMKQMLSKMIKKLNSKAMAAIEGGDAAYYFALSKNEDEFAFIVGTGTTAQKPGRLVVKEFKKEGKPFTSQGFIQKTDDGIHILIEKGNAKPTMIKKSLRLPDNQIGSSPAIKDAKKWKIGFYVAIADVSEDEFKAVDEDSAEFNTFLSEMTGNESVTAEELVDLKFLFAAQEKFISAQQAREDESLEEEAEASKASLSEVVALLKDITDEPDPNESRTLETACAKAQEEYCRAYELEGEPFSTAVGSMIQEGLQQAISAQNHNTLLALLEEVREVSELISEKQEELAVLDGEAKENAEQELTDFKKAMTIDLASIKATLDNQAD